MTYTTATLSNIASFDSRNPPRGKSRLVVFAAVLLGSATAVSALMLAATAATWVTVSSLGAVPDVRGQDVLARKALAVAATRRMQANVAELDRSLSASIAADTASQLAANEAKSAQVAAKMAQVDMVRAGVAQAGAAKAGAVQAIVARADIPQVPVIRPPVVQLPVVQAPVVQAPVVQARLTPAAIVPLPPRREVAFAESLALPPAHPAVLTDTGSRRGFTRSFSREEERSKVDAAIASITPPQRDDRGLIPRLFDALKPPTESVLAYAAPDDVSEPAPKPRLTPSLGNGTAYYDIAAHTVYLPNGERLEAHSGLGSNLDDPSRVNQKNRGATPPNVYELSLRKQLFHGVQALRLNPVGSGSMYGRDGLLAHSYMLGPQGASNGCVSFRQYPKFLQAFMSGQVSRLVVVPRLNGG